MKLIFMGDSTMQNNDANTYPQVGWVQALPLFILEDIKIMNFAKNGCSTKSFIDLGLFEKTLSKVEVGDYCFIQFGHNDAKKDNPMRYTHPNTTYKQNLRYFIDSIQEKGGTPILLTSIYRRQFNESGEIKSNTHLGYPHAMIEVGKETKTFLIDMCSLTKEHFQNLGDEASKRLFMNFKEGVYDNYPLGLQDDSHLRFDGAYDVSKIFINEILKHNHYLRDIVKDHVKDYLTKKWIYEENHCR